MSTRTLTRVEPMSVGKVMGILYAFLGCIFIPFAWLGVFASGEGFPLLIAVFMPVFYGVIGAICAMIGALLFNVAAGWVGGIRVQLDE